MPYFLLSAKTDLFPPHSIQKIAQHFGENQQIVQELVNTSLSLVYCAVIGKITNAEEAVSIWFLSKKTAVLYDALSFDQFFSNEAHQMKKTGIELSAFAFSGNFHKMVSLLAMHSRAKRECAEAILRVCSIAAFMRLGIVVARQNMRSVDLMAWVRTRRNSLIDSLPQGLSTVALVLNAEYDELADPATKQVGFFAGRPKKFFARKFKGNSFKHIIKKMLRRIRA